MSHYSQLLSTHHNLIYRGGWTIVTNSLVNNFGSTLTPFNISYNDLLNVGVGTPSVNSNYQISLIQYRLLANANHKVDYVWYAKSGKSSDPWIKTIGYNNHYLDNSVDFIWYGNLVYFSYGGVAYNGMSISTYDRDKDLLSSVSCVDTYGSFGWYSDCHDAHFWSKTEDQGLCGSKKQDKGGTALCNGYSNYGPDAAGAFNTYYQVKIMIR